MISIHAPARGATCYRVPLSHSRYNFNPRPREGGDVKRGEYLAVSFISIHAPREGGDNTDKRERLVTDISIHAPREGGDGDVLPELTVELAISIHAPREGGDTVSMLLGILWIHFNPRPPRGGRRKRKLERKRFM